jgi:membrane protease subunit HflC
MPIFPPGTPLESAYERMRTARTQEGALDRGAGARSRPQINPAEADAEAAATYAQAFNQDPDFYDFYRAMQSYEQSFISQGTAENPRGRTSIILSPNNEYLRQFRGQR